MDTQSTNPTRKLVATGYCSARHTDFCEIVLKVLETEEEYYCEIPHEDAPEGMVTGSFVRLFEDSTELELFEPVWTAEEIEAMKEWVKELEELLDF